MGTETRSWTLKINRALRATRRCPVSEPITMSIEELEGRLNERAQSWQQALRLMDWDVKVKVLRRHELSRTAALACNSWDINRKASVIEVASPLDLPSYAKAFEGEENDYDVTLVHELLHLHFAPFWDCEEEDSSKMIGMEQAINLISYTLVALDRKEPVSALPVEAQEETAGKQTISGGYL